MHALSFEFVDGGYWPDAQLKRDHLVAKGTRPRLLRHMLGTFNRYIKVVALTFIKLAVW